MAIDITAEADIAAGADSVAAYAFEPTNDPAWIGGISTARLLTPRPIGPGTQVQRLARFLGRTIDYTLEVTSFEPGLVMEMKSVKGPFPMTVTYRVEPDGDARTCASVRVQGTASRHYRIADFLMAPMVKRNVAGDLKRLKKIIEAK
jgi:Polyketide cyclase / dehydrase and lipid transport